ncbi:MAG: aspartyl/asparaginyl beta-hydroxylase domain-containing protein [Pseudomonadales bacterium]
MSKTPSGSDAAERQAVALAARGVQALQRGDAETAQRSFREALNLRHQDPASWFGLALACARSGNDEAALAAINSCLELEPHNLRALLFKGDHHTRTGATRKALAAYQGALRLAQRSSELPGDVQQGLARAQQHCERFTQDYQDYLRAQLAADGYQPGVARFDEALAIAFGSATAQPQQPTRFYYPGLAPIPFFEPALFPQLDAIVAATPIITQELQGLLSSDDPFKPYIASNPDSVPLNDTSLLNDADWGAYYFFDAGEPVAASAAACPRTFSCLNDLPLPRIPGSTPHALFSKLAPQTHIPPHTGLINTRLICHLPLLVPENCGGLRCGNSHRDWQIGTPLIFDDSIEHEAWNRSDAQRVVLIFDLWRPELSDDERHLITSMLGAVARYEQEDQEPGTSPGPGN